MISKIRPSVLALAASFILPAASLAQETPAPR
jgi:hypothetical protein